MSFGIPRLVGEQIRRAGRDDRETHVRAGEHVDAALNHPVAAPGEDELRALVQRPSNLGGRLAALRHLAPERLVDSLGCEDATKLGQSAAERLAGVRDDRDLHARPPLRDSAGGAGHPAREHDDDHGGDTHDDAAADVERVVHPAIHARHRDERHHRDDERPGERSERRGS